MFCFFLGGNDKCFQAAFSESRTSPGSRAIEGGKQTIKEKLLISETKGQYLVLITAAIGETVLVKEITQRILKVQVLLISLFHLFNLIKWLTGLNYLITVKLLIFLGILFPDKNKITKTVHTSNGINYRIISLMFLSSLWS